MKGGEMINETERNEWVELCNAIEMNLDDYAERAMAHCDRIIESSPDGASLGDLFNIDEIRTLASAAMIIRKITFLLMQCPPEDRKDILPWVMAQHELHALSSGVIEQAIIIGQQKGLIAGGEK